MAEHDRLGRTSRRAPCSRSGCGATPLSLIDGHHRIYDQRRAASTLRTCRRGSRPGPPSPWTRPTSLRLVAVRSGPRDRRHGARQSVRLRPRRRLRCVRSAARRPIRAPCQSTAAADRGALEPREVSARRRNRQGGTATPPRLTKITLEWDCARFQGTGRSPSAFAGDKVMLRQRSRNARTDDPISTCTEAFGNT